MTTTPKNESSVPESLLYRCPHCREEIEVLSHLLGETIACPNCDKPIMVEAPSAEPVTAPGSAATERGQRSAKPAEARPEKAEPALPPSSDREAAPQAEQPVDDEHTDVVIHPVIFRRHFFATLLWAVLLIIGIVGIGFWLAGFNAFGATGLALMIPATVAVILGGFFLLKWYIASRMQSLTLTSERLIYRYGIIHRGTSEMRHEDVRNLTIHQDVMERLLSFGDIAVSSAGQDDMEITIRDIPHPEEVADFVRVRQ